MTTFSSFANVLEKISGTSSRNKKTRLIGDFLREAEERNIGRLALYFSGSLLAESDQRTLDISWGAVRDALHQVIDFPDKEFSRLYSGDVGLTVFELMNAKNGFIQNSLDSSELTITDFGNAIEKMANAEGQGSRKEKVNIMSGLLSRSSPQEARFIVALILGDLRIGVSKGLAIEGISNAFDIPKEAVRRAWGACGDLALVARKASSRDESVVNAISVSIFSPAKPMLATNLEQLSAIDSEISKYALEMKYDGARVQIHKDGNEVRIFSRSLTDVTRSLPEIAETIRDSVSAETAILDGEVLAVDKQGKPFPFQVIMRRFGSPIDAGESADAFKIRLFVFDLLLLDDMPLLKLEYSQRREHLSKIISRHIISPYIVPKSMEEAYRFFQESRIEGNEGIMIKRLSSEYDLGSRGKNWYKLKHTMETLDLVIIAAEWGHGRRHEWLSDFHLAVRHEDGFAMIGKTFKGLTDSEFEYITERLLSLKTGEKGNTVYVRPELIVEVIASEVQKSPTYESGLALRFARIKSIREDKSIEDVMSLDDLKTIYEKQFRYKARM